MTIVAEDHEREVVTRERGRELAEQGRGRGDPLEHLQIQPSLLSASHIEQYVLATGLISPFHKGGKRPRLKKASYECRIGSKAYEYRGGNLSVVRFDANRPKVPANSIVFVESDLDFRLPDFIALRFNLHIRHVHRGLLLGTGPLVDPGFWGKLCIPLHNLTSKPYEIPLNEGLIWIEFTKTTSKSGTEPTGVPPSNTGFWNIEDFIRKASTSFVNFKEIPIQSSIPIAVLEANTKSEAAHISSSDAVDAAQSAQATTKSLERSFFGFGLAGVAALVLAYWSLANSQTQLVQGYVSGASEQVSEVRRTLSAVASDQASLSQKADKIASIGADIEAAIRRMEALEFENRQLRADIAALRRDLLSLREEPQNNPSGTPQSPGQ